MSLPARTGATMGDAIAMSSPSGRMSGRAKAAAMQRLSLALFGPGGMPRPGLPPQPSKRDRLLQEAKQCRELAARGFRPRAGIKHAEWCEAQAALEPTS